MARAPRRRWQIGATLCALVCVGVTAGCRTLTVPWEHPTAVKKTPVCDSPGPCGDGGCYVAPPPMLDSDCYGYRFTCWHPWPEHCQPRCEEGYEQPHVVVERELPVTPPVAPPAMPEIAPETPPELPPESTSFAPPSSATTRHANETRDYREPAPRAQYLPTQQAGAFQPGARWSRGVSAPAEMGPPATTAPADARASNYGFLNAVAESSGARRDDAVRPASRVTRLYEPGRDDSNAPADHQRRTDRGGEQRFEW